MPIHEQALALLDQVRALREGLEALDAVEAASALVDLRRIRDRLEAVRRRGESEAAAARSGVGAPARFRRLR